MQALKIFQHGPVSQLSAGDVPEPLMGRDDVLVKIEAAGINPSDIISAEGRFPHSPLPRILGRDFAGVVVQGPRELLGKEVWGSGGDLGITRDGTHAEFLKIPKDAVSERPTALTAEQAAAVGVPFQTAWVALVERGGLKKGEWVVLSGATGAVGGAAIQIASALGANVIAVVRNKKDEKRVDETKVKVFAHTETGNLSAVVDQATGGVGASLVVNGVGAALFQPLIDVLADAGRMVVYSVLAGQQVSVDLMQLYRRNVTIHGVNTATVNVVHGAKILNELAPFFQSGAIMPPAVAQRFLLSTAAEAYQAIAFGKTILVPDRVYRYGVKGSATAKNAV